MMSFWSEQDEKEVQCLSIRIPKCKKNKEKDKKPNAILILRSILKQISV